MGPPHVRGGDLATGAEQDLFHSLQWGRRMFAAETIIGHVLGRASLFLQWGRRMFAAETGEMAEYIVMSREDLQWGRRMFAAETYGSST